jgi:hypothetical protein
MAKRCFADNREQHAAWRVPDVQNPKNAALTMLAMISLLVTAAFLTAEYFET